MTREECMALKPGAKVYSTEGCPDGNPYAVIVGVVATGGLGVWPVRERKLVRVERAHLTAAAALAHFQDLRAAAIAKIEKQLKTLPDRLRKLQARKPVIS